MKTLFLLFVILISTIYLNAQVKPKSISNLKENRKSSLPIQSKTSNESLKINEVSNEYKSVKIGKQIWMTQNLNVNHFRNGDIIPQAKNADEWKNAGKKKHASWCYYNFDPSLAGKYGKLYNFYAINDKRVLAPNGWRIPNIVDWRKLMDFLGGAEIAGNKLKSKNYWNSDNGNNKSGFNGLPGGYIFYYSMMMGLKGYWWCSINKSDKNPYEIIEMGKDNWMDAGENGAWVFQLDNESNNAGISSVSKEDGCSVRCIK
ncbi:MAG: fibrobacter succinogenes major paralogous domain-containing protein [Bacteroidales bacterium]